MLRQEASDGVGVLCVLVHTDSQRLNTTQRQPGIERSRYSPGGVLVELNVLVYFFIVHYHHPTNDVAVSVDILRCAMYDNVRAQVKWLLEVGTGEGVIDDE